MEENNTIIVPHENDILFGRGGKNNKHVGNETLRQMARANVHHYRAATKKGKSQISRDIVAAIKNLQPTGRFLKRDGNSGLWEEVNDDVAREKTSQALRDAVSGWKEGKHVDQHCQSPDMPPPPTPVSPRSHSSRMEYEYEYDHQMNDPDMQMSSYPPVPPPSIVISSPPSQPRSHHNIPVVSPTRNSPHRHHYRPPVEQQHYGYANTSNVVPNRYHVEDHGQYESKSYNNRSRGVSPTPNDILLGGLESDMSEFDLFNGAFLKKTDSASSGSLSFTKPSVKKMKL